jgi:hypothetical protein
MLQIGINHTVLTANFLQIGVVCILIKQWCITHHKTFDELGEGWPNNYANESVIVFFFLSGVID